MASLSERIAAGVNMAALGKAEDLKKRIWFTLGALIIYRLGSFVPLPGINSSVLAEIFSRQSGGILGMFDMFTGGALSRMTIFALNIMPYISASIIVQLGQSVLPSLMALKKEGEAGHRKIVQYTRYLTVLITIVQGYGISVGLESMSSGGASAVLYHGWFFRFTTVVTLVGGTMFIVWLGEQITARGVGNGSSLIIMVGIIANMPTAILRTLELGRVGQLSPAIIVGLLAMALGLVFLIVFVEKAQRRIVIQYPKRQVGMHMTNAESSHLPLKINPTGVIPPIFASSILLLPITIANFSAESGGASWVSDISTMLGHGKPLYLALYSSLIIFFTFFYTSVVFNPEETAENLKRHGGFVAGIRPGKNTAEYLDYVITRLTVLGAFYLTSLCVLPELLISKLSVPFFLGGTTLMIVVQVTMDFVTQVQSHMIAHQYEGLLKKASLAKSRKR